MAERFAPGDRVRTRRTDEAGHCRLPRYARGALGTVVEHAGDHPLADDRARGLSVPPEPVYTVRFDARELFGEGDHAVTVEVWHSHLTPVEDEA